MGYVLAFIAGTLCGTALGVLALGLVVAARVHKEMEW